MIVDTFQFIPQVADAPLRAGPECPEATGGTILFTNDADGFCLLLLAAYTVEMAEGQTTAYVNSMMGVSHPRLFINVEEANGRPLAEVTRATQQAFADSQVMGTFGHMLDGVPANQFDRLPGQDLNRQVLVSPPSPSCPTTRPPGIFLKRQTKSGTDCVCSEIPEVPRIVLLRLQPLV